MTNFNRKLSGTVSVSKLKQAKLEQLSKNANSPRFIESQENLSGIINNADLGTNQSK